VTHRNTVIERLEPRTLLSVSLVKDINTAPGILPGTWDMEPTDTSTMYIAQEDTTAGWELWKSDGTAGGTTLIKDIRPGRDNSQVGWLTYMGGGDIFFTADDGVHGFELWKSDGTEAGTVMVKDIAPGLTASTPGNLLNVNGTLFFTATTAASGTELWTSDGSDAGTVMVQDIYAGSTGSAPSQLINNNGTLFFRATTAASGAELWKSDGTSAGTVMIKEIYNNNNNGVQNTAMAVLNGVVYFAGITATSGMEIWKSDGTSGGTVMIQEITAGSTGSAITGIKTSGNYVYFNVGTGANAGLWRTDGTGTAIGGSGTVMIAGTPSATLDVSGTLFFSIGTTLYSTTGSGFATVKTGLTMSAQNWASAGGSLYFPADDGTGSGQELWKSDGTTTFMLKDLNPGTAASSPYGVTPWGSGGSLGVMFPAATAATGVAIHKSDGTTPGTQLVKDVYTGTSDSGPLLLTPYNGKLYFLAFEPGFGSTGGELYSSDGTEAGTGIVIDLNPGAAGGNISNLKVFDGYLYFVGTNGTTGNELWRTDGTAAGTTLVADINAGTSNSSPFELTVSGSYLYFGATTATNGTELWRTDGTTAGTIRLSDVFAGVGNGLVDITSESGGTVYFTANNSLGSAGLWKSNGTPGTTSQFSAAITGVNSWLNINGRLYLAATTSSNGTELFKIDPGDGAPVLVKEIASGSGSSSPQSLTNMGGTLYFTATTSANGRELWKSDGTDPGTAMVKDINPGSTSSSPGSLAGANGVIYFRADGGNGAGAELWRSDGTSAGTFMVKDINPGATSSSLNRLYANNGFLYFAAANDVDGTSDIEPWISDGTAAGTVLLSDLYPKDDYFLQPSNAAFFTAIGSDVYFRYTDDNHGAELWKASQPDFAVPGAGGALAISATGGNDAVDLSSTGGNLVVTLNGMSETFAPGAISSIQFAGLGGNDVVNVNSGSVSFTGDIGAGTPNLSLRVAAGATAVFNTTQHIADLQLNGGHASVAPGGGKVLLANALSITGGGALDLRDDSFALDYSAASPIGSWDGSTYTGITGLIKSGRNGGSWNGSGIVTSLANASVTTLGVAEASQVLGAGGGTIGGQSLDGSAVIVKYTYGGDANLDGKINVDDYTRIDFNVALGTTGWYNGDFNYDGKINVDDYTIIDFNVGIQGPPILSASTTIAMAQRVTGASSIVAAAIQSVAARKAIDLLDEPGDGLFLL
jgi:ELWxxDGT repeat protein